MCGEAGTKKPLGSGLVAEGVGFEPTDQETPVSGLANRRTRPTMRPFQMALAGLAGAWCQRGDSNPHALASTTP